MTQLRDYPTSLSDARSAGSQYYMTGTPCKNGHTGPRQTSNRTCVECARKAHEKWVEPRRQDEADRYRKWRAANLEKARECSRVVASRWVKSNKARHMANCRTRKARKKNAEGRHTGKDISRILKMQKGRCAWCRSGLTKGYHVDHIQPLALGGSNWPSNLQCLCPTCNLSKRAKDPLQFARDEGRLL